MEDMTKDTKGFLDKKLGKFASRKLLVFLMATLFFCLGMVGVETWEMLAIGYVGIQGFVDAIARYRETA